MATWRTLERRRTGLVSSSSAADRLRSSRLSRLELNVDVEIKSPHHGPIAWLDVDGTEERYLLTGGADCTIAVFDLDGPIAQQHAPDRNDVRRISQSHATRRTAINTNKKRRPKEIREVGRTPRMSLSQSRSSTSYGGHRHSLSVVRWYPVDTGLFVSGAMDGLVKLWDTNALEVVLEFDFKSKVFAAAMSNASGRQHLLAVGTDDPQARLCDIRSGASAHVLTGHSEAVWACAWSPRSDFLLATGSADQKARLWDIRRSGASACLISLDQHRDEGEQEDDEEEPMAEDGGGGSSGGVRRRRGSGGEPGYLKHRKLAPQASRVSKFARAHAGPVNSLCFTSDGRHLLTGGTDNRLRLWDVDTGCNTMMNYLGTKNRRRRPFGMAVAQPAGRRSESVFFPNDKSGDVLVFPLHSSDGRAKRQLRAHFEPVQCCAYRSRTQELVTCGADGLTLLWSASEGQAVGGATQRATRASYIGLGGLGHDDGEDRDAWSSDDDERRRRRVSPVGSGHGAINTRVGNADARAGNSSNPAAETGGTFVPPILMQERR